jgi:hypothetical protein
MRDREECEEGNNEWERKGKEMREEILESKVLGRECMAENE